MAWRVACQSRSGDRPSRAQSFSSRCGLVVGTGPNQARSSGGTSAKWSTMQTGWNALPPGQGDPDYVGGVAVGGPVSGTGGHGYVVIRY